MPNNRGTITQATSVFDMPEIRLLWLIHSVMPLTSAPTLSVAMSDSIPITTTRMPLIAPTSRPAAMAARMAQPTGMPIWAFNTAITIADSDSTDAADRSYSLAVNVMTSEQVSTACTACELKIEVKLATWRKL